MTLRHFLKDRRAGVTPMFALAIIPVFGLIGAAVDYSRANSVRTALQAAADATALAMSKDAASADRKPDQHQGDRLFPGAVQPPRGEEPRDRRGLHHDRRIAAHHHGERAASMPRS